MALDLHQLKTFWAFARLRSVTQTAERMFVTQSAVSHALKKLERSAGTRLSIRRGREYELTEAGAEHLERWAGHLERIASAMARTAEGAREALAARAGAPRGAPPEEPDPATSGDGEDPEGDPARP